MDTTLPPLRAISFDWGDTLAANTGMPYEPVQRRAFSRFEQDLRDLGGKPGTAFVERCLREQFDAYKLSVDTVRNPAGDEMDYLALFARWVTESGLDPAVADEAVARCEDELTDVLALFASVEPVLSELKRRGYLIGILSHIIWSGPACERYFKRHQLDHLIDAYSFSSAVGRRKPDPRHFDDLIGKLGVPVDSILHIGDNPGRDITGAHKYGFKTCLLETGNVHNADDVRDCNPDLRIVRLTDLLELLP
ncbi:MAG: HAD family hydrolase [Planctomycetota bacterium]|jgi:FMN phosphatase YigB (HAD superfamily)|nr:HAD family hydrolase [Planctomycetota bacterium]